MLIGVNWTSPSAFTIIERLVRDGSADFCEILIDNFLHLSPEHIREALGNVPLGFHIMRSRFLEREDAELLFIGKLIRHWIKVLNPLYVSDHLAQFTHKGRGLPLLAELNYLDVYFDVKSKILTWQEILDCNIAFENFPSSLNFGKDQLNFLKQLTLETNCKLLFDFSNAVIAEKNCGFPISKWEGLINKSNNFHAGGYRESDTLPSLLIDSHDTSISQETFSAIKLFLSNNNDAQCDKTLVIERDANIDFYSWKDDLLQMKRTLKYI